MGIKTGTVQQYGRSVRDLFPQGDYWEKLFMDAENDLSLFCKAKTQEIMHLRKRMGDLLAESDFETAVETIDDWERVLLGYINPYLSLEERRERLRAKQDKLLNQTVISQIAERYGLTLIDIVFPFKPSFFGFSSFGRSVCSTPAFFSVFYIRCSFGNVEIKEDAKSRINRLLNRSSFGLSCFGTGQFLGRFYFIKDYASRVFSGMKTLR